MTASNPNLFPDIPSQYPESINTTIGGLTRFAERQPNSHAIITAFQVMMNAAET